MRIFRLAQILSHKYKVAEATELEKKKADILRSVSDLWKASVGGLYGEVLRDLTSTAIDPDSKYPARERLAAESGKDFLIELLNTIDVFKANLTELPFDVLRDKLVEIIMSIEEKMDKGPDGVDFPEITSLVFVGVKNRTLFENEKFKKAKYGKARKGLIQLHGMAKKIINSLNIFEGVPSVANPDKKYRHHQRERLTGKPAELDNYDVFPFLMQYGDSFGLRTQQDWATLFRDDPQFKREIAKTIHALNSGHYPRNEAWIRDRIGKLLAAHKARKVTNEGLFDVPEEEAQRRLTVLPAEEEWSRQMQEAKQQKSLEDPGVLSQEQLDDLVQKRDQEHEQRSQEKQKKEEEERNRDKFGSHLSRIMEKYQ